MLWLVACGASPPPPKAEPALPPLPMAAGLTVREPLASGSVLTADDLVPMDFVAVEGIDWPERPDAIVGMTVAQRLLPGEPVRRERLVDSTPAPGLAALARPPERLVELPVPPTSLLGVHPGETIHVWGGPDYEVWHPLRVARADASTGTLTVFTHLPDLEEQYGANAFPGVADMFYNDNNHGQRVLSERRAPGHSARFAMANRKLYPGAAIRPHDIIAHPGTDGMQVEEVLDLTIVEPIFPGEWIRAERVSDGAFDGDIRAAELPQHTSRPDTARGPLGHPVPGGPDLPVPPNGDEGVPGSFYVWAFQRDTITVTVSLDDVPGVLVAAKSGRLRAVVSPDRRGPP